MTREVGDCVAIFMLAVLMILKELEQIPFVERFADEEEDGENRFDRTDDLSM